MNKYVFLIAVLIINFELICSSGSISGIIVNPENSPIAAVVVKIPSLKTQTSTKANGEFEINNIPSGKYQLKMSRAGCRPLDTIVEVKEGNNRFLFVMLDIYRIKQNIVVTGTRTAKQIESNPIATDVVTSESISSASRLRLDNVLNEELGMVLVEDHGKGIQIQGLDPDYALILVNGEPLIGRNGGILDVRRLAMGNIKRVEVVKGPSSSLYGSNALAGVINLITNEPNQGISVKANARYESYNTIDLGIENGFSMLDGRLSNNLFVNRLSSDGFKITEKNYGKAVPEYVNYTLSNDFMYKFDNRTSLKLGFRLNSEDQVNFFDITENGTLHKIDDNSSLKDYGITLTGKHQYSELFNIEARAYHTKYATLSEYTYKADGAMYDRYTFDQTLSKAELQWNWMLAMQHILTFGGGASYETVEAQRLNDGTVEANAYHAFIQEDWIASKSLNVLASLRYDWHSDYSDNLSPKLAVSFKLFDGFVLKGSIGSGFKAPTFQQLYLDWTNSIAGYSVFGVSFFQERFAKLVQDGVILDTIVNLSNISDLKPERSFSFNFGFVWDINDNIDTKLNVFRNNISEMIETLPVANKNNGSQVWSYFNLNEVYTQGLEYHFRVSFLENFKISLGYQYLEAIDVKVLDKIKQGKVYMNTSTGDRKVRASEYGGLMNRSKHSANIKLEYDNKSYGFNAFLRGNYRGRYGFEDKNHSTIIDADNEYAPDYSIWNITLSKTIYKDFNFQLGIDNVFEYFAPKYLPSNPGRTYYINCIYNFSTNIF